MMSLLQVDDRTITATELLNLLVGYRMLPQLERELMIDQAIASIELTEAEPALALEQFHHKHQLTAPTERRAWLERYGLTDKQLAALAMREFRIEKFKQVTWGPRLESYFLSEKSQLDQALYSLIRTQELEIATELYFRIQAQEQSFAECASTYSQGPEARTGGLLGPVELSRLHPTLAKLLSMSQAGQLWPPTRLGDWFVIVRLEQLVSAQLDEPMQKHLLNRLFESWLLEQSHQPEAIRLRETPQVLVAA